MVAKQQNKAEKTDTDAITGLVGKSSADPALAAKLSELLRENTLPGEDENFGDAIASDVAHFLLECGEVRKANSAGICMRAFEGTQGERRMAIAIFNDDMPFLVDSLAQALAARGIDSYRLVHPVAMIERDAKGKITAIHPRRDGEAGKPESIIFIETERVDEAERDELQEALVSVLEDVRAAVSDWLKMKVGLGDDAESLPEGEGAAMLRWLLDDHFTLLASEHIDRDGKRSNCLGIARRRADSLISEGGVQAAIDHFANGNPAPLFVKANYVSTIHRHVLYDIVCVPIRSGERVTGLSIHVGLWTSEALATSPTKVPLMRAQLAEMMTRLDFDAKSHAGKSLTHAMTALPHDLMVGFPIADQQRLALTAMSLADRPRPKLVLVRSPLRRHVFAFVWLPRDDVSTQTRQAIDEMLVRAADAKVLSWALALEDGQVALLRFTLDLNNRDADLDEDALDRRLRRLVRGWTPAVEVALADQGLGERALPLADRFGEAFPQSYRYTYGPKEAASDIVMLDALEEGNEIVARMYRLEEDADYVVRLKIYHRGDSLPLSDVVPTLENFGFVVREEIPTEMVGTIVANIHDFRLVLSGIGAAETLLERADAMEEAIVAVLRGLAENDDFNALMSATGVDYRAVVWLRAWFRYLRQTGLSYSMSTVIGALTGAPNVARALVELFMIRHDPAFDGDDETREEAAQRAEAAINDGLEAVQAIDEDRILRLFRALIEAILRTNAFADFAKEALAFKFDSARIPDLPKPLPWREIFVYSPRVEGVHLRAGPVARGGIRWSDRRDDFRTEILGLMKAQRVKNAVIVPTGAKGGFYPKQLPNPQEDRAAWGEEGKASYQVFIRALLSVTDNLDGDKVVHPDDVRILDDDDPYFVVAADKGTARFSDVANAIAEEQNFWLGDAFASGGSNGYDHKAMGITARGAWVSVQRHFAEMGIDVQKDPVTVVGVGDMSGDVFGNGMLLSKSIRLQAAFDHRHIFIDPDPNPATSWEERKRLFDLPSSSWDDYNRSYISKGGGVFARSEKSIKVSPEMRDLLGIEGSTISPGELMSAILKADADLLWFGGIGTYVRSARETDGEVGDPANDRIRVAARDLGVKVIGEGANLGITQEGRIEFARGGGRINTDFIDNSAGVDCSDNEVNIKIPLNREMRDGDLEEKVRNRLLAKMTEEVADIVLEDNRLQALGLSIAEFPGPHALPSYVRLIERFEDAGHLDRQVEGLAEDEELLRRAQEGQGLTRPELAVLLSTAKMAAQDALEACRIGESEALAGELLSAFPKPMQDKHEDAILTHRLRNELVATKIANRMINRLGLLHPFELAEEENVAVGTVGEAYWAVERLFDLPAFLERIDTATMPETARIKLFDRLGQTLRLHMADLIRTGEVKGQPAQLVERIEPGLSDLEKSLEDLLNDDVRDGIEEEVAGLQETGVPEDLARSMARLKGLNGSFGIVDLAIRRETTPVEVARAFTQVGELLDIDWVQSAVSDMEPSDPWERLLLAGVSRDVQQVRLQFIARARSSDFAGFLENWTEAHGKRIEQFRGQIERVHQMTGCSVAALAQVAQHVRLLLSR